MRLFERTIPICNNEFLNEITFTIKKLEMMQKYYLVIIKDWHFFSIISSCVAVIVQIKHFKNISIIVRISKNTYNQRRVFHPNCICNHSAFNKCCVPKTSCQVCLFCNLCDIGAIMCLWRGEGGLWFGRRLVCVMINDLKPPFNIKTCVYV